MTKVFCPCVECVYNGRQHKCTADKLKLSYRNMATVTEGRVDMWICDHYKLDEWAQEASEKFNEYLKGLKKNDESKSI